MHYGDERGSNSLEGVKALVILGLPIPNVKAFKEEAEGFLYDFGELDCTWVFWKFYLPIVGGQSVHVNVDGYGKALLVVATNRNANQVFSKPYTASARIWSQPKKTGTFSCLRICLWRGYCWKNP